MARNRAIRLALAAALALLAVPASAAADGDPASDVLLTSDAFYPYKQVSAGLVRALDTTLARATTAGYPIKVALIAERTDLGTVPGMLGRPQQYAEFLHPEISFNANPRLLVVMAHGFGLVRAGPASALASVKVDSGGGSDALAQAAIRAVQLLARQAGHPFAAVAVPKGSGSGGTPALLVFGGPVALVALVAGFALLMRSRRDEDEDQDDAELS